jgi:hypothetical protein
MASHKKVLTYSRSIGTIGTITGIIGITGAAVGGITTGTTTKAMIDFWRALGSLPDRSGA